MQQSVPVAVAADELPLGAEPAVGHLLMLLELACDPDRLTEQAAADLLLGPLSDLDASDVRRLGRALREQSAPLTPRVMPPSSDALLCALLTGRVERARTSGPGSCRRRGGPAP
jgi:hypothetical protein